MATAPEAATPKIRLVRAEDIDWLSEVCANAYPGKIKDWDGFKRWWLQAVNNRELACLRTDKAFIVCALQRFFYDPSLVLGKTIYFASEQTAPWDMVALVRTGARWAAERGAKEFEIDAITGIDPRPLAARLGNLTERPAYRMRLEPCQAT